mgnify:CR=1 FL=1
MERPRHTERKTETQRKERKEGEGGEERGESEFINLATVTS